VKKDAAVDAIMTIGESIKNIVYCISV